MKQPASGGRHYLYVEQLTCLEVTLRTRSPSGGSNGGPALRAGLLNLEIMRDWNSIGCGCKSGRLPWQQDKQPLCPHGRTTGGGMSRISNTSHWGRVLRTSRGTEGAVVVMGPFMGGFLLLLTDQRGRLMSGAHFLGPSVLADCRAQVGSSSRLNVPEAR